MKSLKSILLFALAVMIAVGGLAVFSADSSMAADVEASDPPATELPAPPAENTVGDIINDWFAEEMNFSPPDYTKLPGYSTEPTIKAERDIPVSEDFVGDKALKGVTVLRGQDGVLNFNFTGEADLICVEGTLVIECEVNFISDHPIDLVLSPGSKLLLGSREILSVGAESELWVQSSGKFTLGSVFRDHQNAELDGIDTSLPENSVYDGQPDMSYSHKVYIDAVSDDIVTENGTIASLRFVERLPSEPGTIKTGATINITKAQDRPDMLVREIDFSIVVDADAFVKYLLQNHNTAVMRDASGQLDMEAFIPWFADYMADKNSVLPVLSIDLFIDNFFEMTPVADAYSNEQADSVILDISFADGSFNAALSMDSYLSTEGKNADTVNKVSMLRLDASLSETASVELTADSVELLDDADPALGDYNEIRIVLGKTAVSVTCDASAMLRCLGTISDISEVVDFDPYGIQDILEAVHYEVYSADLLDGLVASVSIDSIDVDDVSYGKVVLDGAEQFDIRDGGFGYSINVMGLSAECNFTDAEITDPDSTKPASGEFIVSVASVAFNPVGNYVTDIDVSGTNPVSRMIKEYLPNIEVPAIGDKPGGLCCDYLAVEYSNLTEIADVSFSGFVDKSAYDPLLAILLAYSGEFDLEKAIIEDLSAADDGGIPANFLELITALYEENDFDLNVSVGSFDSSVDLKMGVPYWTTPEDSAAKEAKFETSDKWFFTICDKSETTDLAGLSLSVCDDQVADPDVADPDDYLLDVSVSLDGFVLVNRTEFLGYRSNYVPNTVGQPVAAPAMMHTVTGADTDMPAMLVLNDLRLDARASLCDLQRLISFAGNMDGSGDYPDIEFNPTFGLYLDLHIGEFSLDQMIRDRDNGVNSVREGTTPVATPPNARDNMTNFGIIGLDVKIDSDSDSAEPFISVTLNADEVQFADGLLKNTYREDGSERYMYEVSKRQRSTVIDVDALSAELYLDMRYTDIDDITQQEIKINVIETLFFLLLPETDAQCITTLNLSVASIFAEQNTKTSVQDTELRDPLPEEMAIFEVSPNETHINNKLEYETVSFSLDGISVTVINDNEVMNVEVSIPSVEYQQKSDEYQNAYQSLRAAKQAGIRDLKLDVSMEAGDYFAFIRSLFITIIGGSSSGPVESDEAEIAADGRLTLSEMEYLDDYYIHTYMDVLPNPNLGKYALNAGRMQVGLLDFSIGSPSASAQNPAVDVTFDVYNISKELRSESSSVKKSGTDAVVELKTLPDTAIGLRMVTTDGITGVPSGKGYSFAVMKGDEYTVDLRIVSPNLDMAFVDGYGFTGALDVTLADADLYADADVSQIRLETSNLMYDATGKRVGVRMVADLMGAEFLYDGPVTDGFVLSGSNFILPQDSLSADSLRLYFDAGAEGKVDLTYEDLAIGYTGGEVTELIIDAASVTGNVMDVSNTLDTEYRCLGDELKLRYGEMFLNMSDLDFPSATEHKFNVEAFLIPIRCQSWNITVIDDTLTPNTVSVEADLSGLAKPFLCTDINVATGTVNGVEVPVGTEIVIGGDSRFNGVNVNGMEIVGDRYRVVEGADVELVVRYVISLDYGYGNEAGILLYDAGEAISLPVPVRDGYTFSGWETLVNGEYVPFELTVMPENDLEAVATWTPVKYKLTYDFEGFETIATTVFDVDCGATHNIIAAAPEKEGYTFCGWKYRSDTYCASKDSFADLHSLVMPAADVTLTPVWAKAITVEDTMPTQNKTTLDINGDRLDMGADVSQGIAGNEDIKNVEINFKDDLSLSMSKESLNKLSGGSGASGAFGLQATSSTELGNLKDALSKDKADLLSNVRSVVNIEATGGSESTDDLGDITVTLPFDHPVKPGEEVSVRYVSENGQIYDVEDCEYDPVAKTVSFRTTHFSTFAISVDPVLYDVNIDAGTVGGTIMVSPAKAAEGAEVEVTVLPDTGKKVTGVSVKVDGTETILPCVDGVFVMPAGSVTVSAVFADILYSVTADEGMVGGTLEFDASTAVKGQTVNVTVVPEKGKILAGMSYDAGKGPVAVSGLSFVMPAADVVVTAVFENIVYDITIADGITGGVIDVLDDQAVIDDKVLVLFTPDEKKQLKTLTYTVAGEDPVSIAGNWFVMPAGDVTVTAEFEDVSESDSGSDSGSNNTLLIIGGVIGVLAIVALAVFFIRKQ